MAHNDSIQTFLDLVFLEGWHHTTRHWRNKHPNGPNVMIGTEEDTVPAHIFLAVYLDFCTWRKLKPVTPTRLTRAINAHPQKIVRARQTIHGVKEPVYIGIPLYVFPEPDGLEFDNQSPYVYNHYELPKTVGDFVRTLASEGLVRWCGKLTPPLPAVVAPDGAALVGAVRDAYARFTAANHLTPVSQAELSKALNRAYGQPVTRYYGKRYMAVYPDVPLDGYAKFNLLDQILCEVCTANRDQS